MICTKLPKYKLLIHNIELRASDIKKLYKGKKITYTYNDMEEYHIVWKSRNKKLNNKE